VTWVPSLNIRTEIIESTAFCLSVWMSQEDTLFWRWRWASFYFSRVDTLRYFIVCLTPISVIPSYISYIRLGLPNGLWGSPTTSPCHSPSFNQTVISGQVTSCILSSRFYVLPLGETQNFTPIKMRWNFL
jgi:hypothetical protein